MKARGHRASGEVAAQERARLRVERPSIERVTEEREARCASPHREVAAAPHRREVAQPSCSVCVEQHVARVEVAWFEAAVVHLPGERADGRCGRVVAREAERGGRDALRDDVATQLLAVLREPVGDRSDCRQAGVERGLQVAGLALALVSLAERVARLGRDRVSAEDLHVDRDPVELPGVDATDRAALLLR